jgi:hypothetical protein
MPYYYVYHVKTDGHVFSRTTIYADDDEQAVEKARAHLDGRDIEVWDLDRKVGVLKHLE